MSEIARKELVNRHDLLIISEIVSENSSVLDLGCGNGALLQILMAEKNIYGYGIEIEQPKILECVKKGVPVLHGNLNDGLTGFTDKSFDFVVLSQTLQAVSRPDILIDDMMRVGRQGLVSFINFGYITNRLQLFFKGRMPVNNRLPDNWYDTLNIHLATICDFRKLCEKKKIRIIREIPFGGGVPVLSSCWSNLFAPTCVFVIEKD